MDGQKDKPADVIPPASTDKPADVTPPAPALTADEITALIAKNKAYEEHAAARVLSDKKAEEERLKAANEFEKLFETEKERADRLEQENAPLRKIRDDIKAEILEKLGAKDDPVLQSLTLEQLRVIESKLPKSGQRASAPGGVGGQGSPNQGDPYEQIEAHTKAGNSKKAFELMKKHGVRF